MGDRDSFTYSLDELADAAGMTARNVRAYQSRGLLQPPLRQGRAAVYDGYHLARLLQIRRLREVGVPLRMIADAAGRGESLSEDGVLLTWATGQQQPPTTRHRREVDAESLHRLVGAEPELPARWLGLGVLRESGGRIFASADIVAAANDLLDAGVSAAVLSQITTEAAEMASTLARRIVADIRSDLASAASSVPEQVLDLLARLVTGVLRETLPMQVRQP
jgi:DNA-binding transcriptional MerR regulator